MITYLSAKPICPEISLMPKEIISAHIQHTECVLKPHLQCVTSYLLDSAISRQAGSVRPNSFKLAPSHAQCHRTVPKHICTDVLAAFSLSGWASFSDTPWQGINELAGFVVLNNYFGFNDHLYIQNSGTAISTKMSPSYAIIFMHILKQPMWIGIFHSSFVGGS